MGKKRTALRNTRVGAETLRKLAPTLDAPSQGRLLEALSDSRLRGQIPVALIESILAAGRRPVDQLMLDLLPVAQLYAEAPLSDFRVGAVVRGASGSLYLGANLEVPRQILGFAVHAEQAAVANAFMHDESGLESLAVTAAPCGHCRQFLNELRNAADLKILVKGSEPATLGSLLPKAFGPDRLNVAERLFSANQADLELTSSRADELSSAALKAASKSYAPYTRARSGIAIRSTAGAVRQGSYIECAAYNPSLSPLQAALAGLIMGGERPGDISAVVLAEMENAPISQKSATRAVLDSIAPAAPLTAVTARWKQHN